MYQYCANGLLVYSTSTIIVPQCSVCDKGNILSNIQCVILVMGHYAQCSLGDVYKNFSMLSNITGHYINWTRLLFDSPFGYTQTLDDYPSNKVLIPNILIAVCTVHIR